MRNMRLSFALGVVAATSLVAFGCSDDDETGDADTTSSASGTGASGASGSGASGGAGPGGSGSGGEAQGGEGGGACEEIPDCVTCNEVLTMGADALKVCKCNGPPSSAEVFGAFGQCACVDMCAADCGTNACQGGEPTMACLECADAMCTDVQNACLADM